MRQAFVCPIAEFDFRYNHQVRLGVNDMQPMIATVRGAEGKRLSYQQPDRRDLPV